MTTDAGKPRWFQTRTAYGALIAVVAAGAAGATALLMNIFERKAEQRTPYVRLVEVTENDTDPAKWGKNWPAAVRRLQAHRARDARRASAAMAAARLCPRRRSSATRGSSACSRATPSRSTTATGAATPSCSPTKSRPSG